MIRPVEARRPRARRRESGQGLAEFALVVPVIVFLVVGFIEIGRAVYSYTTITNAARQGARVAAVNQVTTNAECDETRPIEDPADAHWTISGCVIAAGTSLGLTPADITTTFSAPPGTTLSCAPVIHVGCIASVTVTYAYAPSTPLVSGVMPSITMTSTSQMPVERVFP